MRVEAAPSGGTSRASRANREHFAPARATYRSKWHEKSGNATALSAASWTPRDDAAERRFLTLPFALNGQPTFENLSLLCSAHNAYTARRVFGDAFITEKRALRELSNQPEEQQASAGDNFTKVQSALMKLGFRRQEASQAMNQLRQTQADAGLEALLRAALRLLTPGRG